MFLTIQNPLDKVSATLRKAIVKAIGRKYTGKRIDTAMVYAQLTLTGQPDLRNVMMRQLSDKVSAAGR